MKIGGRPSVLALRPELMGTKTARFFSLFMLVVGAWLFLSAFVWPHSSLEYANTVILGIIIMVAAVATATISSLRYLVTLAGAWLIVSALFLRTFSAGTRWNNFVVGIVVALLSLAGSRGSKAAPIDAV